jgi:hypothetical protein
VTYNSYFVVQIVSQRFTSNVWRPYILGWREYKSYFYVTIFATADSAGLKKTISYADTKNEILSFTLHIWPGNR